MTNFLTVCILLSLHFIGICSFRPFGYSWINSKPTFDRNSQLSMNYDSRYLEKLVKMKQIEVENLLRRHTNDSVFIRMHYFSMDHHNNISVSLRKDAYGSEKLHKMGIMIDMKRNSPTVPHQRNIVEFPDAAKYAKLLTQLGADAIMVNTEETLYGGKLSELEPCSQAMRRTRPSNPPACIAKDIFIHPIQIALALENGASGVLLNTEVLGQQRLRTMLDACTFMGVDAIVEVHTPSELEMALAEGAVIFLVNMWDRPSGRLFPQQAKKMSCLLPMNTIAVAAGNIKTLEEVAELGYYGYDSIVLGRNIVDVPDIKKFIDGVHAFTGRPRVTNLGMKSMLWEVLQ